jgi:hypothetical protein
MGYQDDIKEHLETCDMFHGELKYSCEPVTMSYEIYCNCGHIFRVYPKTKKDEKEIKMFCEAAKMFPKVPRQNAVELDEVIDPILGFCLDHIDLDGF